MPKIKWRFIFSRLALMVLGLVFSLLLMEGLLHIFPSPNRFALNQQLVKLWESDDELLMHLKPNLDLHITAHPEFQFTVHTNADGLRDEPIEGKTFEIATIGDSFTFGFGVEDDEAYPSQLEKLSGKEVLNLGWVGWNSYVYPVALRRYAIPSGSRIWLWGFFNNDLPESTIAEEFLTSGKSDYKATASENLQLSFPFTLRSFQFLAKLFKPELAMLADSGTQPFDNGQIKLLLSRYAWNTSDPTDPDVQHGWELTENALQQAHELAASQDATLIVIFIPTSEHVYWPLIESEMTDVSVEQLDDVALRLETFCAAHGILYLNLLDSLRDKGLEGETLYFAGDGHWNAKGHELAAHAIYAYLLEQNLLGQ